MPEGDDEDTRMECPDCCGNGGWFDGVSDIGCELCGGRGWVWSP